MQKNGSLLSGQEDSAEAGALTAVVAGLKVAFPRMVPARTFRADLRERLVAAAAARDPNAAIAPAGQPGSSVLLGAAAISLAGALFLLWRRSQKRSDLAVARG